MSEIIQWYDATGDFVTDAFFDLLIPGASLLPDDIPADGVLSVPLDGNLPDASTELIEYVGQFVQVCNTNPSHKAYLMGEIEKVRLSGSRIGNSFVPDEGGIRCFATSTLAKQIRLAGFVGYRLHRVNVDGSLFEGVTPELEWLEFTGRDCIRGYEIRTPVLNLCQNCGWGPVVCPECKEIEITCPRCMTKLVAYPHESELATAAFAVTGSKLKTDIVDVDRWDGSDFIEHCAWGHGVVTRPVVDWLLSFHANPFIARPLLADVSKAPLQLREQVQRMKRS